MTQQLEPLAQTVLWRELEDAADIPEEADLSALCQMLDQAIALVPDELKLKVAGEAIVQLAGVYASRANALLDAWERSQSSLGPVLSPQGLADLLIRQSMRVDLSDLIQVPDHKYVRSENPFQPVEEDSMAGPVDKDILLEVLEYEHKLDDEAAIAEALGVAHSEDISAWVEVIFQYFSSSQQDSLSLVELSKKVKYPLMSGEKKKSALIKTWIALLLGGFALQQQGDFYDAKSIRVSLP